MLMGYKVNYYPNMIVGLKETQLELFSLCWGDDLGGDCLAYE